jgi:phosphomannomutase
MKKAQLLSGNLFAFECNVSRRYLEAVRRRKAGGGGISDLLSELKEPQEEAEVRLKILADDFKPKGAEVLQALESAVAEGSAFTGCSPVKENFEGYRVRRDEGDGKWGWFLLRQSLHDPVMVLNFESEVGALYSRCIQLSHSA